MRNIAIFPGDGIANRMAAILAAAMPWRYSFGRNDPAARIEGAVRLVPGRPA